MISTWKDIAVVMDATEQGQGVALHAARLARRQEAHLVGVYGIQRQPVHPSESYARGEGVRHVAERHRRADEEHVLAAGRAFSDLAGALAVSSEFRVVWRDALDQGAALRSLHCDLIVAGHPKPRDLPDGWTGERLLLATGTPVLLIPNAWTAEAVGQTVVVAWNGSRAVRRAVNDALPFLLAATQVVVLAVDGARRDRTGEDSTTEITRHLERHDVTAIVRRVDSGGAPVADVIWEQCANLHADLLVVGAYSHPRTTELLFGGVTRTLLAECTLPLFLSR